VSLASNGLGALSNAEYGVTSSHALQRNRFFSDIRAITTPHFLNIWTAHELQKPAPMNWIYTPLFFTGTPQQRQLE